MLAFSFLCISLICTFDRWLVGGTSLFVLTSFGICFAGFEGQHIEGALTPTSVNVLSLRCSPISAHREEANGFNPHRNIQPTIGRVSVNGGNCSSLDYIKNRDAMVGLWCFEKVIRPSVAL